jgi:tetratricopeptide (TPR) repeat protein
MKNPALANGPAISPPSPPEPREASRRPPVVPFAIKALAMIALTLAAYLPAMRAGFIWDDGLLITGNPLVITTDGLRSIWFSGAATDYTPLTLTAFRLEWHLWGGNAPAYHIVNILLHLASVLLLWRVLRKLAIPGAWLGATLFAIHPVNVASVAWIAEQKNTLSLLFLLLAVDSFIDFRARGAWPRYLFALLAAACALLSKGSTVVLPLVLLCCIWARESKVRLRDLVQTLPFFALAAGMALVTIQFQHRYIVQSVMHESAAFRIIRAGQAIWFYIAKDLLPLGLCPVYPKWPISPGNPLAWLGAAGVVALFALFWLTRKSWGGPFLLAFTYFLVSLLPVLGFVNMGFMDQAYVADWWQEIALIGIAALVGAGIATLWQSVRPALQPAISAAAGVIVLILTALTWQQALAYQSMETYSRHVLALNPDSWSAHTNLATALATRSKIDEAMDELRQSLRLNPFSVESHNNLGTALLAKKRTADALAEFVAAISINSHEPNSHCNLGNALEIEGRYDEAIAEDTEALQLNPLLAQAHYNLASASQALGRLDVAITHYREALRLEPAFAGADNNLGNIYQKQGDPADAIPEYRKALALTPNDPVVWFNLATALAATSDSSEAIDTYQHAIRADPKMVKAPWNLAALYLQLNRIDDALVCIEKTLTLDPAEATTYGDAASLLAKYGRYAEALPAYRKAIAMQPDAVLYQNRFAWLLATCPDDHIRNGAEALDIANSVSAALGGANPIALHTLAAAYAETGRFPEALATARQALSLAGDNPNLAASLRQEILLYQKGAPVRQP